ncbi:hypothetical protein SISSUDRAFT_1115124 [Sistotremastrum suecicum HHB10207 ss-3]|uniref:IgA peptidase M64-domain-containing protein n=1 Tax=Sistotremastrum suecicum HHB10207 ss-3 TaxID=1314776 RepID=A0A165ZMJ7_9AGAM|nr:hypothetical protein SISSUDRAFT_1115124 [Sistotremastrum suecicum HHB10207 ss-3]
MHRTPPRDCVLISEQNVQAHKQIDSEEDVITEISPLTRLLEANDDFERIRIWSLSREQAYRTAAELLPISLEVVPLLVSGPSSNRVDLVFFGDGYTESQRALFLADSKRLAGDIAQNQTMSSVRPLLNFWAAFSPSQESGVGVGGNPKNTTFGLYRDGTELRAVYCSKKKLARAACRSLGDACDYPILLGNDPLYGGLGGEFTISTSSIENGPLVLRHELGHSILRVGEEYDGGFAYYGYNAEPDLSAPPKWSHWLTDELQLGETPRAERSVMSIQAYPWTLLQKNSPYFASFESSGRYARHLLRFSISGVPHQEGLTVEFDGEDIGWQPKKGIGYDRWHYDFLRNHSLSGGNHTLSFNLSDSGDESVAQLCSFEVIEYGTEKEFNSTLGHVGAYPTFSLKNETSFRPTNDGCLMRSVTLPNFCSPCLEGLWLSLLRRVDLIDEVTLKCVPSKHSESSLLEIALDLLPLAHLREDAHESLKYSAEAYVIHWELNGIRQEGWDNSTVIQIPENAMKGVGEFEEGSVGVHVQFLTLEVRRDVKQLLQAWRTVRWHGPCT